MTRDYKEYNIIAEAERDPENGLFKALIFISTVREGISSTIRERQPKEGSFSNQREAELHGIAWAMDWIDRKTRDKEIA
jgi:hypothetical protein